MNRDRTVRAILRWGFALVGLFPWLVALIRVLAPGSRLGATLDLALVAACHRLPARTLSLGDVPMPVCSRCAGVYAGLALGAIAAFPRGRAAFGLFLVAVIVSLGHVIWQETTADAVSHGMRLATGALFGYAAAVMLVSPATAEKR